MGFFFHMNIYLHIMLVTVSYGISLIIFYYRLLTLTPGEYIPRFLTTVYTKLWPKNIQLSCITAITSKIDISNNREYVLD